MKEKALPAESETYETANARTTCNIATLSVAAMMNMIG
jgi:hypothetical protein